MERIEFHIRGAACSLLSFQYAALAALGQTSSTLDITFRMTSSSSSSFLLFPL
jgi:hypothetical protein